MVRDKTSQTDSSRVVFFFFFFWFLLSCPDSVMNCMGNKTFGIYINGPLHKELEPAHDKTYKIACAPSDDSYQSGHPSSLIRVFAMHSVGS